MSLYALRWGFSPPKAMARPPKKLTSAREYGLDAVGRLRVVRKYRAANVIDQVRASITKARLRKPEA